MAIQHHVHLHVQGFIQDFFVGRGGGVGWAEGDLLPRSHGCQGIYQSFEVYLLWVEGGDLSLSLPPNETLMCMHSIIFIASCIAPAARWEQRYNQHFLGWQNTLQAMGISSALLKCWKVQSMCVGNDVLGVLM